MGKKSSGPDPSSIAQQVDPFSQSAANIANQSFTQTDPLRQAILAQYGDIFGATPFAQPQPVPFSHGFAGKGNISGFNTAPALNAAPAQQTGTNGINELSNVSNILPMVQKTAMELTGSDVSGLSNVANSLPGIDSAITDLTGSNLNEINNIENLLPLIQSASGQLTVNPDIPELFGGAKAALENQFSIARDRVLESLPQGGSLNAGLVNLEGDRALGLSQILADLSLQQSLAEERGLGRALNLGTLQAGIDQANLDRIFNTQTALNQSNLDRAFNLGGAQIDINQRNLDRALNLATGGATNALQGFSIGGNLAANSALAQAQIAESQAQRQGAKKQGTGQAAGKIAAAAIMSCWVAREVYGEYNPKWMLFRFWLIKDAPKWLRYLYMRYGPKIAVFISDKPFIKNQIRKWMDMILRSR